MRRAHAGLHVRDVDFDRVVDHLAKTLAALGVAGPTIGAIAEVLGPLRAQIVDEPAVASASNARDRTC